MKIKLHKNFEKRYKNQQWLNRSINITGDLRVIYKKTKQSVVFVTIGTHSNLYG